MAEICPELKEYEEWYQEHFKPKLEELALHVKNCPKCQELLFSTRDKIGLKAITTSDEEMLQSLEEITRGGGQNSIL